MNARAAVLTEFVGTLVLVMVIGMTGNPLAVGLTLIGLVYMGRAVSGAQYNPAVALATAITGDLHQRLVTPYTVAQILGAFGGALVAALLKDGAIAYPLPSDTAGLVRALGAEVVGTCVMVLVILNVACSSQTKGNPYFGVAIGLTVMGMAYALGPVSGAAFNPAVGIALPVVHAAWNGTTTWHIWIYALGPIVGAVLAVAAFRVQSARDLPSR